MSCGNPHVTPCSEVLDRMYTYLDGELGEPDLHLVREHLEECAPCMSQHDVDLVVKKLLRRSCGGDHAPEELRERIVLQITQLARTGSATQVSHLSVEINR
ncbi:MAG: mycothiol system anti-sigma-R factor [Kineosporiaceae bacterium]